MLLIELLFIAIAVAVAVKYVRLPYTIALVITGIVAGPLLQLPDLPVDPHLWLLLFLPPLLFEGTINMDLEFLRRYARPVGLLALGGTLIQVVLLSAAFATLLGMPIAIAGLLAVMLSPTDPVAVLALFKENGVAKGLQTIVEGESVFNDGVAVVLYLLVLQVIGGEGVTLLEASLEFVKVVAGGVVVGGVLGYLCHRLYAKIDDHLVEVGLSLVLAYGSYLIAERFHFSGVIAVVLAGLIVGNYGRVLSMSPSTRLSLGHFWEVAAFMINGLLFLLIGLTVEFGRELGRAGEIVMVFGVMLLARAIAVYGLLTLYRVLAGARLSTSWIHAINWSGLRGSIPVALALVIPAAVPQVGRLQTITLGAVFLSLLVQGLTIEPLLRRLGLVERSKEQDEFERSTGISIAAGAALRQLDALHREGEISERLFENLRQHFEAIRSVGLGRVASLTLDHETIRRRELNRASVRVFEAQRVALDRARRRGLLSEEVWRELAGNVDALMVGGEEEGWEQIWRDQQVQLDEADPSAPERTT